MVLGGLDKFVVPTAIKRLLGAFVWIYSRLPSFFFPAALAILTFRFHAKVPERRLRTSRIAAADVCLGLRTVSKTISIWRISVDSASTVPPQTLESVP